MEIQDDFDPPFEAVEPAECRGPVLFNSPHSGRVYPRAFLHASRLDIAALRRMFMRLHRDFGAAILIDCHSMPSATGTRDERPRADFVLGDRYGTSCVPVVAETIEQTMREFGYAVSRNKPYAGGFITEHYGNPTTGLHTIQLEINRALYMDERRYERSASFARLAGEFEILSDRLAAIPLEELRPYRAAAE